MPLHVQLSGGGRGTACWRHCVACWKHCVDSEIKLRKGLVAGAFMRLPISLAPLSSLLLSYLVDILPKKEQNQTPVKSGAIGYPAVLRATSTAHCSFEILPFYLSQPL